MIDQEKFPPICLPEQEVAERLARDVQRIMRWRAICESAAGLPQADSESETA